MKIVKINSKNPDRKTIKSVADVLKKCGLVVYPTDTAYGLGGNALDKKAVKKVYNAKQRDFSKPTHVVVRNWKMIEELTYTNKKAKILYKKFLPGPLTLILNKKKMIPDILTGSLTTLGVRMPNNPVTQLLSNLLPFPYTTPSANKSGGKTPYSIEDVKKELDVSKIDLILDAGKLKPAPPSTIVDLTADSLKILRKGSVAEKEIAKVLQTS